MINEDGIVIDILERKLKIATRALRYIASEHSFVDMYQTHLPDQDYKIAKDALAEIKNIDR